MRDFNYNVNLLVKAYLNDWLRHMDPCACVVGNMISGGERPSVCNFTLNEDGHIWHSAITHKPPRPHPDLDKTGYSLQEIIRIESAFEKAPGGKSNDDWMFNGLMAVVEVLADIHNISLEETNQAKELFVKA